MSDNVWCPSRRFRVRGRIRIYLAVVVKNIVSTLPLIDGGGRPIKRRTSAKLDRQGGEDEGADNVLRSMVLYPNYTVSYLPLSGSYKMLNDRILTIDQSSSNSGG